MDKLDRLLERIIVVMMILMCVSVTAAFIGLAAAMWREVMK